MNTSPKKSQTIIAQAAYVFLFFALFVSFFGVIFAVSGTPHASAILEGSTDTIGDYQPLTPLGGLDISKEDVKDLPKLLTKVFQLMLGGAAALSVLMITWGGIEYLSTDTIFGQSEGKKRITNALKGLALAIAAWLILYTINPKTLEFSFNVEPPPPIQSNTNQQRNGTTENEPCPIPGQVRISLPDRTTECR